MKFLEKSQVLRTIMLVIAAWMFCCGLPVCTQAEILYEVIDLGTLGGDSSCAYSINDAGQIVGGADKGQGDSRATLFDPTGAGNNIDLGMLGGDESLAWSINNAGQIVGKAENSWGLWRATLFDSTGAGNNTDLGTLGGGESEACYINDSGQIVGRAHTPESGGGWFSIIHATLFDSSGAGDNLDLGTLGRDMSWALSINNAGQIVGNAAYGIKVFDVHAILFDPTGAGNNVNLGGLGGGPSGARSINDTGQIVGWAWEGELDARYHAILFDPTGAGNNIDLGTLGGVESMAEACSINDAGQIVGWAYNSETSYRATLFDPTGIGNNIDLNTRIDPGSGWTLETAYDINNKGWIVGQGYSPEGHRRAFLLIPKYSGGTGEPNDPYQIATADDLMLLGESPEDYDKHFILTADIDLDPNLPGRKVFDRAVIAPDVNGADIRFDGTSFMGVFDGNNHVITRLHIMGSRYLGLYGHLDSAATIRSLILEAVDVNGTADYVGGLAGINSADVTGCCSSGTIKGKSAVGGLIGLNEGNLTECYSTGTVSGIGGPAFPPLSGDGGVGGLVGTNKFWDGKIVKSYSTSMVIGDSRLGGLVGTNGGSIKTSYSIGWVCGISQVGGLVGSNYMRPKGAEFRGDISLSYSAGRVIGENSFGGLVGDNAGNIAISFWDTQTSGQPTSAGGDGKTTAEMKQQSTFEGWDFINVWGIGENQTYPYLRKYSAADINRDESVNFGDLAILAENWLVDNAP